MPPPETSLLTFLSGGRPHWAKIHFWTFQQASKSYPKWKDFLALRERLDPKKLFWNAHMEKLFEAHPKLEAKY